MGAILSANAAVRRALPLRLPHSPFSLQYLSTILSLCPHEGYTLETGIGSGFGAIWLSLRGVCAKGLNYAPGVVEPARQINSMLGGSAAFRIGDLFHLKEAKDVQHDGAAGV